MSDENIAVITHNTYRIIAANRAACAIFHCAEADLIDLDMIDIVADPDMRGLARLRLNAMRVHGLGSQDLPLFRPDNTRFYANVKSHRIDEKTFESYLSYIREIP
jgi:PAS domain-containing protein